MGVSSMLPSCRLGVCGGGAALCGGGAVRTADSRRVPAVRVQRGRKGETAAVAMQRNEQHCSVCKRNSCLLRGSIALVNRA